MSFTFGAPAAGAAAPATGSSFSFGSAAPAAAAAPTAGSSGGFLFGSSSGAAGAPASGGPTFGFGAPGPATPAASSSAFSFGGNTTATSAAAPAASSGFGFGGTSTTTTGTTGGFGFGTTPAPATSTGPTFGFGASASTTKPPLFGQKPATTPATGFGFNAAPAAGGATSGFNFGAKPAGTGFGTGTTGFGGFGTTTTTPGATGFGGFGAAAAAPATGFGAAPVPVTTPAPIICGADASVAQLNTVKYAYEDPMQSRFKFLMYNTVDPTQRHLYVRPPHISERLWNQAEMDNPDPLNSVPVPIMGFKDLLKRIKVQQEYADKYSQYTTDLRNQVKEMEKASRATEEKIEKCRHEHVQLFHALVKIMKDIEFLQQLGKPLQHDEIKLAMALKKLQVLLDAPGQYKARLNDAVALQRIQDSAPAPPANQLSPTDLERLFQFLDKQRQGLEQLTSMLNDDLADIKLMKETWRR